MTLSEYIREVGVSAFAKQFRVSERAAESYMYGTRRPKPRLAARIVEKTPVDWEGVFSLNGKKH
jgi:hypothetical protein